MVLGLLVWRFGADAFLDGVRRLDAAAVAVALVLWARHDRRRAWRWTVVARGIGLDVPLRSAVAAYYRSQLVNVTVPGGVVGDVERAVRHGRGSGELAASVRSVGWERFGGQAVQLALTAVVLLVGALGVPDGGRVGRGRARRRWRSPSGWPAPLPRGSGADASPGRCASRPPTCGVGLLSRRALPRVLLASAVVVAGHAAVVVVAARATGIDVGLGTLVPLALVVLAGSAIPANVAGWGPREGVAAWAFAAAGLGATAGVTAAAAYGALVALRRPARSGRPGGRRWSAVGARRPTPARPSGRRPMPDRPYTLLSCCVSLDGYLDDAGPQRLVLSPAADLDRVDAERAGCDAILVGAETVRRDDPRLLVRSEELSGRTARPRTLRRRRSGSR